MKIAVAMSGGVDSSAAAAILKDEGHELVGFTMQLWNQRRGLTVDESGEPMPSRCCSLDDVYDARRVAEDLGFPFYVLNLEREFEREVVERNHAVAVALGDAEKLRGDGRWLRLCGDCVVFPGFEDCGHVSLLCDYKSKYVSATRWVRVRGVSRSV